ncbi:MAG: DUF2851 family protein [Thermomicrobiales bacterium]
MTMVDDVPELAISLAWHRGLLSGPFRSATGENIEVVHRGVWSHGFGPDFSDAMILFNGRDLRTGAVEIHRHERGWTDHGHHRDPRYNSVILHVALTGGDAQARTLDGALIPTVILPPDAAARLPEVGIGKEAWTRFGGTACAPDLAIETPEALREAILTLGDRRLAGRAARIEARLTDEPASEVLWSEILDGLGFSANRAPMRSLAALVPLGILDAAMSTRPSEMRLDLARSLLFGAAGYLPFSPGEAALADMPTAEIVRIEQLWASDGGPWLDGTLPPTVWTRARARPANHPAARIAAAAAIAVAAHPAGGLLAVLTGALRDGADPAKTLASLAAPPASPGIGADRAGDIVASSILPFAIAFAESVGDHALSESASRAWETLPAPASNAITRRALTQITGGAKLPQIGGRGMQGLIHLDTNLCATRRCYECPIAHRVLAADAQSS